MDHEKIDLMNKLLDKIEFYRGINLDLGNEINDLAENSRLKGESVKVIKKDLERIKELLLELGGQVDEH
ncbi:MAG: hypothetical protein M1414_06425 [Candidatus Thermoplasmatota archaeon]|jgi:hypothetical protein|nr:hypothetical protein [Candidatus Thermoplasmatota archaeon]